MLKYIRFKAPYLPSKISETIIGTRSGGSIVSIYAILKHYGIYKLRKIYEKCYNVASYFRDKVLRTGKFKVYGPLETPIVCFKPLTASTNKLLSKLKARGWIIYKCSLVNGLRIVFMPHVTMSVIRKLLDDLIYAVEY
ncbi:MAG: hypothetical protein B6U75_04460 [Desulfurococcales archaeon ex4484_217_1]|nr:MAG: hypothetical protein B6U75_04460 [Desulfurococcales archaeon ex4484_217_1]